jgi:hypothetical protein
VNTHAKCIAPGLPKPYAFGKFFKSHHPANALTDQPTPVPDHCFFNPAMKWLHSVVHEPDFVDPWTAISQAFHLAFELGFMNGADANFEPAGQGVHTSLAFQQPCPVPRRSVKSVMSVQFCPDVDLYIGSEDCLRFFQLSIPEETLSMSGKPWSVGRRLANPCPVSLAELPPVLSRSHCEAIDFADSAVQGKLSFTGFDANDEQPSDQTPGCYSFPSIHVGDWQNHNSVHVDAHPRTCFDGPDHIVDTPPACCLTSSSCLNHLALPLT